MQTCEAPTLFRPLHFFSPPETLCSLFIPLHSFLELIKPSVLLVLDYFSEYGQYSPMRSLFMPLLLSIHEMFVVVLSLGNMICIYHVVLWEILLEVCCCYYV